jgi:hypothetical protein
MARRSANIGKKVSRPLISEDNSDTDSRSDYSDENFDV